MTETAHACIIKRHFEKGKEIVLLGIQVGWGLGINKQTPLPTYLGPSSYSDTELHLHGYGLLSLMVYHWVDITGWISTSASLLAEGV